jgi:hypothetical protein
VDDIVAALHAHLTGKPAGADAAVDAAVDAAGLTSQP